MLKRGKWRPYLSPLAAAKRERSTARPAFARCARYGGVWGRRRGGGGGGRGRAGGGGGGEGAGAGEGDSRSAPGWGGFCRFHGSRKLVIRSRASISTNILSPLLNTRSATGKTRRNRRASSRPATDGRMITPGCGRP